MGQLGNNKLGNSLLGEVSGATGTANPTLSSSGTVSATTGAATATATPTLSSTGSTIGVGAISGTTNLSLTATGSAIGAGVVSGTAQALLTATGTTNKARATANLQLTSTGVYSAATEKETLGTQWKLLRDGTEEPDLYNATVVDTANPFGNFAVAKIDDRDGSKFDKYERGTKVEFQASQNTGISFSNRFTGYVVEAREADEGGADVLEVEAYSFDQFLRRGTVSNDQTGKMISGALENIIKNDTPVTWDSSNVTVDDDTELTQSFQGDRVENALLELRQKSANEQFGVNDSVEFFFEPREQSSAPRDIDNTQWFNYDIPEIGKEAINEVTVFYNDGSESVTVDDGADKLDLQDSLGTARPAGFSTEVARPNLTNLEDAKSIGENVLSGRESTLTGTVTTYGLVDANPGDVININIIPRGIDGDFQIAEIEYNAIESATRLTIVEKRGQQDEVLVRLSDTLKRVELQDANREGISNRVIDPSIGVEIAASGDVGGQSFTASRITNSLRNAIRDGWADNGNPNITELRVGSGSTNPNRSQSGLANQSETLTASETFPASSTVRYTASATVDNVTELGVFTGSGDMMARATVDAQDTPSLTFDLTSSDNANITRGVITNTGQQSVRDVIGDNSPNLPQKVDFGSDGTDPSVSNTSLGTSEHTVNLDELLIQAAATQSDFNRIVNTSATEPVEIDSGKLKAQQSNHIIEAETGDIDNVGNTLAPGSSYSSPSSNPDGAFNFDGTGQFANWNFTNEYKIPADNLALGLRYETSGSDPVDVSWTIDATRVSAHSPGSAALQWDKDIISNTNLTDLDAGTHTLQIEVTGSGTDAYIIDVMAVYDDRFSYTFDNTTNADDSLSGPELYPDLQEKKFDTANTGRDVTSATVDQSWNDTTNKQKIELSNDDGSTWNTTNNSQTASANFASANTGVDTRIGLSRFGSQTDTPTSGVSGQEVSSHDLEANIDAITAEDTGVANVRSVIPPNTISSTTLKEIGQLDSSDNLLTRSIFADVTVVADQRILSSERIEWANP